MDNYIRIFNSNSANEMLVFEEISRKRQDVDVDFDKGVVISNPGMKTLIKVESGQIILLDDVRKIGKAGTYNYVDFLCMIKFKDNYDATCSWIKHHVNEEKLPFICVGTDYYKVTEKADRYGYLRSSLKLWKLTEIKPFHGKDSIFQIPRYDDFCVEPNNIDYEPIINNNYNMHSPFDHEADMYGGKWPVTEGFLRHIFSSGDLDNWDEAMTYLQCLYLYPKKPLPILVLVSTERQTGKTTFVDYLSILFGENMVVVNPEDIGSSFNSSYADKNVIAIEESKFESNQTTEKLKNLATQKKILVNAKHQQPYSLPFFGKLIITSNDDTKFSKVDEGEIRYWVRHIPSIKGKENHNIIADMMEEIPFFLKSLLDRDVPDWSLSRQVIPPERLQTNALKIVKDASMSQLYRELYMIFEDLFLNNEYMSEVSFTPSDLKDTFYARDSRVSATYIKKTLEVDYKLKNDKPIRYSILDTGSKKVGRAFTLKKSYFHDLDIQGPGKTIDEPF